MAIEKTMNVSDIIDDITTIADRISDLTHIPPDVRSSISEKLNFIQDELDRCSDEYGDEEESWDNEDEYEDDYDYDYNYDYDE